MATKKAVKKSTKKIAKKSIKTQEWQGRDRFQAMKLKKAGL